MVYKFDPRLIYGILLYFKLNQEVMKRNKVASVMVSKNNRLAGIAIVEYGDDRHYQGCGYITYRTNNQQEKKR
jgi:hypothetical protein